MRRIFTPWKLRRLSASGERGENLGPGNKSISKLSKVECDKMPFRVRWNLSDSRKGRSPLRRKGWGGPGSIISPSQPQTGRLPNKIRDLMGTEGGGGPTETQTEKAFLGDIWSLCRKGPKWGGETAARPRSCGRGHSKKILSGGQWSENFSWRFRDAAVIGGCGGRGLQLKGWDLACRGRREI